MGKVQNKNTQNNINRKIFLGNLDSDSKRMYLPKPDTKHDQQTLIDVGCTAVIRLRKVTILKNPPPPKKTRDLCSFLNFQITYTYFLVIHCCPSCFIFCSMVDLRRMRGIIPFDFFSNSSWNISGCIRGCLPAIFLVFSQTVFGFVAEFRLLTYFANISFRLLLYGSLLGLVYS